ncbi:MAG: phosphoribosylglycinamide formyltransferase [Atribacterales bacterium]|nr:phosphoribosylglycinamide formyltransferase [Atribacterota bacterium]
MNDKQIVVLVSGRGTNLQALIETTQNGYIPGKISLVVSDNPQAFALERARRASIPTLVLDYDSFPHKRAYEDALFQVLEKEDPQLICLAGYMRIVGKRIIMRFRERIINIHPSLLPAFPGLEAQKQALEYGVKISGCTVHLVDEGMDTGPIILQASCPVEDEDTVESLSERILQYEHQIYPQAVKLFLEDKLNVIGRRVFIKKE